MSSKTFAERMREDRRLVILRLLSEQPEYQLNSSNVHAGLQHLGVHATRADLLQDLRWMAGEGLLNLESLADIENLYTCTVTHAGWEVARGMESVTGVSRPAPRH